ncbi:hypothetical protein GYMLUDRAFT_938247 [Collybiopsis luxurians FD-317 M1]|uniref:Uncharacterized protein n=1 Tax=Collybiopsis luxurians FD-317 M1 TaxID=944289 RepID=A0A0D0BUV3_9AGAR|nr:hypothetical protein GYMLUDRAFT_938247 [Collybiopsis luxurians FD-317 M1]
MLRTRRPMPLRRAFFALSLPPRLLSSLDQVSPLNSIDLSFRNNRWTNILLSLFLVPLVVLARFWTLYTKYKSSSIYELAHRTFSRTTVTVLRSFLVNVRTLSKQA